MWFTETHNCDFPQFLRVRERPGLVVLAQSLSCGYSQDVGCCRRHKGWTGTGGPASNIVDSLGCWLEAFISHWLFIGSCHSPPHGTHSPPHGTHSLGWLACLHSMAAHLPPKNLLRRRAKRKLQCLFWPNPEVSIKASLIVQLVNNPPAMQETRVWFLESGRSAELQIGYTLQYSWASLVAQLVKNPPAMQETWVWSLGWEDPLEKGKATHSSILAWRIHGVAKSWAQLSDFHFRSHTWPFLLYSVHLQDSFSPVNPFVQGEWN